MNFSNVLASKKFEAVICIFVLLGFAGVYITAWKFALSFPLAVEYEGTMLWAADQLAHGFNIYDVQRLTAEPYAVITYPPLFMGACAGLFAIFGDSFPLMRAVSIVAAIGSALLFFRILRIQSCSLTESAIGTFFFFGFSPVFLWSSIGRVDSLALFFALLGFERMLKAEENQNNTFSPTLVLSGAAFALSSLTKQTAIVCVASAFIYLIWIKRNRLALMLAGIFAAIALTMCAVFQIASGGFLASISFFGKVKWEEISLLRNLRFMSDSDVTRSEIIAAVPLFFLLRGKDITKEQKLAYAFTGLSLLQMLYIFGLPGSNGNHAIFPLLGLSWWAAIHARNLYKPVKILVLVLSLYGLPSLLAYLPGEIIALPADTSEILKLDLKDKSVLSEDPYFNVLTGSKPYMIDCAVFTSVWKYTPEKLNEVKNTILSKKLTAIIINDDDFSSRPRYLWPSELSEAIRNSYFKVGEINGNGIKQAILKPKP